ncbi:FAS-associated death domain protein [Mastacembelus armatus]|uniref:Fas (tnfrsf6)-associated via death domain n=1 Tax=Mastacembelus armatus TaxID=205130 RepID=A0A7N8X102_9TELE|nr:FAS-associated death domain protein [Mastacembelus armatus]
MSSLKFPSLLLDISSQLSADQLDKMKFLCRDMIGKRDMEKVSNGLKLFQRLMERGELGADNTEFLSKLLEEIQRQDLLEKLRSFESQSGNSHSQPDQTERAKLDISTEVISENLGRNWRKLGRKLGLNEVKLESISSKHPTDLEETAVELLKEWRRIRGAEAQTKDLIGALRACEFNLTADKVEDRLTACGY